jgi:ParB family chromosome partitioning protein
LQKFGRLNDDYGAAKCTKAGMAKSGCVITLGYDFFDRVSSAQIISAATEACGKDEAAKLAGMKKGDMAKAAERLTKGEGWLPAIPRGGKWT